MKRFQLGVVVVCLALIGALESHAADKSCGAGKMWIPEGSNVEIRADSSLRIVPPSGFVYVGRNRQGTLDFADEGGCSCDCTSSSGKCLPSIYQGNCSCTASGGCTACSLTTGGAESAFESGGFIDLTQGVSFLARGDEKLPAAFGEMFELKAVREALDAFLGTIYPKGAAPSLVATKSGFRAPTGYALAPVNVFGRVGFVVVPRNSGLSELEEEGGGSCSCTAGSCTYASTSIPFKGTLHYCEGNCSGTCTLTLNQTFANSPAPLAFDNTGH